MLVAEEIESALAEESELRDERLALMFACAHPAIAPAVRAPLILQTVLGFDAARIGSAFLVSPASMSQRLVRAKHKLRDAGIRFAVPAGAELAERLPPVLEAIYAAFAEGWADPAGSDARRRELAEEALWLARLTATLLPGEAEALALLALLLYAQARSAARRSHDGAYVPLAEQDAKLWNEDQIAEAEALLLRSSELPGATGRYQLEAAVQSAHVARRRTGRADWLAIERIYEALFALTGSPVVAVNRAVALAEARGALDGLAALDALSNDARLADYQPYWAARAELLARCDRRADADLAYERAIGLENDPVVRDFLAQRRATTR